MGALDFGGERWGVGVRDKGEENSVSYPPPIRPKKPFGGGVLGRILEAYWVENL